MRGVGCGRAWSGSAPRARLPGTSPAKGPCMVTSDEIAAKVAGHTVATRFRDTVRAHPDRVALRCRTATGGVR